MMKKCFPDIQQAEWGGTEVGKHSYGPLAHDHYLVKRVGAFCSFASGVSVVPNHLLDKITTHPMLVGANSSYMKNADPPITYDMLSQEKWYIPGIQPQGYIKGERRITIGNDVWLGLNVIITNYSNIGDGVIAAAGSVITKDVPDYAVVAGVPARIIRYRFNNQQIQALKRIQWWNWNDDIIRKRYDDFFLPIDQFINKYDITR